MLLKLHCETTKTGRSSSRMTRYLLVVAHHGGDLVLQVIDRDRGSLLLDWQGTVVRHLLESGVVPTEFCQPGDHPCDKSFVWHLMLAGAATQMVLDQMGCTKQGVSVLTMQRSEHDSQQFSLEMLAHRLALLNVQLAGPQKWIARLLFAYPGQHFSAEDVRCLLLLECPLLVDDDVSSHLDDLARSCVIQRIEVDSENVFYDIDTAPHLHLFDPQTRKLSDAKMHGIIHTGHGPIDVRVQIGDAPALVADVHVG